MTPAPSVPPAAAGGRRDDQELLATEPRSQWKMTNGEGWAGATTTQVGPHAWWHGSTR